MMKLLQRKQYGIGLEEGKKYNIGGAKNMCHQRSSDKPQ